jgi:argininosuccinate synthase
MTRVVLAYSGGVDTSVAIPWLIEQHQAEVVTVTLDVAQGIELEEARDRALASGAVRAHVIDARTPFARDFILPALKARAIYEDRYPLATALSRPLVARQLVEIARLEGATAVAHGAGRGHDRARLETAVRALDPSLEVIAPARLSGQTRAEAVEYARRRGVSVPASAESPYRIDRNLWGRSIAGGALDDPWREPPDDVYSITRGPAEAPDAPAYVEISFENGVPVAINGVEMAFVDLIQSLETIAGSHAVGRVDMIENRLPGAKSREIYEAPAAVVLHAAHRELQTFVTPRDLERLTSELAVSYADLVYNGQWYTPMREAMDALVAKVQERVTGVIRLKLFKGDCRVVGRSSPHARYDRPASITGGPETEVRRAKARRRTTAASANRKN